MPSNAAAREIYFHPYANVYQVVHGIERRTLVDVVGGPTVAQQIAELINQGAIDRRPGSPNQLLGPNVVYFLEALENV
jgi:hypothetical protein